MLVTNLFLLRTSSLEGRNVFQMMGWNTCVFVVLIFSIDTALTESETMPKQIPNSSSAQRSEKCENDTLNECWNQLPPFPDQGIPSSPTGVNTACKAFETGMKCVHGWTKRCLGEEARKKIMDSVRGAHEAFAFLCNDQKFRDEFLSHSVCYKQISIYWDECANRFINHLKGLSPVHYKNMTNLCCIRRNFMRCVSEVAHHHCSKDASIFLLKMAETLVRTTMRGNTPQTEKCESAQVVEECDRAASSCVPQPNYYIVPSSFLFFFLANRDHLRPTL